MLAAVAICAAEVTAARPEPHIFDALYMIVGSVEANGAPGGATGRKVVFYSSYPNTVYDTIESGKYTINIYDNMNVAIDPLGTYYIAVEQAGDGYGATPESFTLSSNGWMQKNLRLVAGAGPGASTEAADDGWIISTDIQRVSGHARLLWAYNGTAEADIWRASGEAGTAFTSETSGYIKIVSNTSGTQYDDTALAVGSGKNAYYRVVPAGVAQANIFGSNSGKAYNKRTVGKADIYLAQQYNAICYPFNLNYIDIPTLIGTQLLEGDQVHWWNQPTQAYQMATKVGSSWSATHSVEFADGFFVYITPAHSPLYLTLVGIVNNFAPNIKKPLKTQYNLVGYPYPVIHNGSQVGFAPREGDQLHKWNAAGQAFTMSTYVSGNWNNIGVTTFEVGAGKFYYAPANQGPYDWQLVF